MSDTSYTNPVASAAATVRHGLAVAATLVLIGTLINDILGIAILGPLIPSIAAELKVSPGVVALIGTTTMIGMISIVPLSSALADRFGHRRVLLVTSGIAAVGAVLSATAANFEFMLVARFFVGFGVVLPFAWGLTRSRATSRDVQGISSWASVVANVFGALSLIAGAAALEFGFGWRTVLWALAILMIAIFVLTVFVPETPGESRMKSRIDVFGAVALGLWVALTIIAITVGPMAGWSSPVTLALFGGAVVVLVAWIVQQRRSTAPLMSLEGMDKRQGIAGLVTMGSSGVTGIGLYVVVPSLAQTPAASGYGLGLSPIESALPFLGTALGAFVAAPIVGRYVIPAIGPKFSLMTSGLLTLSWTLGLGYLHAQVWEIWLWCLLAGITTAALYTVGYSLLAASLRRDKSASVFAIQTVLTTVVATVAATVILNLYVVPGPSGFVPESNWQSLLLTVSALVVALVVVWLALVPWKLRDMHAIDTPAEALDTMKVTA